jgi:uncharacterized membrane protein YhaH (DUF805 family)
MQWYLGVLQKYVQFSGRARRQEFWMFVLFNFIITVVLSILDSILGLKMGSGGSGLLSGLYGLAVLLPSLAVSVRRLHDTNRSGWWILLGLVPIVGIIVLIVWYVQDSDPGDNRFGPNPKEPSIAPAPAI